MASREVQVDGGHRRCGYHLCGSPPSWNIDAAGTHFLGITIVLARRVDKKRGTRKMGVKRSTASREVRAAAGSAEMDSTETLACRRVVEAMRSNAALVVTITMASHRVGPRGHNLTGYQGHYGPRSCERQMPSGYHQADGLSRYSVAAGSFLLGINMTLARRREFTCRLSPDATSRRRRSRSRNS